MGSLEHYCFIASSHKYWLLLFKRNVGKHIFKHSRCSVPPPPHSLVLVGQGNSLIYSLLSGPVNLQPVGWPSIRWEQLLRAATADTAFVFHVTGGTCHLVCLQLMNNCPENLDLPLLPHTHFSLLPPLGPQASGRKEGGLSFLDHRPTLASSPEVPIA